MLTAAKRFWIRLTSDKRRFGALCVVLAAGLLLWARLIVITNMPRHAIADPSENVAGDGGGDGLLEPPPDPPIAADLDAVPLRDPFLISPAHFPKPTPVADLVPDAGKSAPETVETQDQAHDRKHAQLRKLVDRLRLEAVMTGLPMAVIDGRTYRLGEWIPAVDGEQVRFKLVEVRSRSIILEYEDHRFELNIAPPGHD